MKRTRWLLPAGVLVAILSTTVTPASAQWVDCGTVCSDCSQTGHEGTSWAHVAPHDMTCYAFASTCWACPASIVEGVSAETIDKLLAKASLADIPGIAATYGDRLLINPDRAVVVVQGTGCDPEALARLIPLAPEVIDELAAIGIESLETYLTESALES